MQSSAPIEPQSVFSNRAPVIFLGIIAVIAAFFIERDFIYKAKRLAQRQTRAIPRQAIVPAVPLQPLTENDVEHIFTLPLQQQAEELLDHSLHHDERARGLLQKHLADYKGQVRDTPRMKDLLNRAQYSRDLRVRYLYCDMMLAMDGWSQDSDAIQILTQRAQNEPDSRAYDVWFLGMLGRVKPERVRTVLLGYAQNDPNENVRLWATEGLRFVGTDQALDDLFSIFLNDPSFRVRDRAGCNVSDCGNFTRKQRMRFFPKFLELAENPATNAQMRTWSLMAMQGITDVSLPSDAKLWRQWYTQHGAEKMAEFDSIPEWQVRGDE